MKKLISFLLAAIIVCSMVPATLTAFAESDASVSDEATVTEATESTDADTVETSSETEETANEEDTTAETTEASENTTADETEAVETTTEPWETEEKVSETTEASETVEATEASETADVSETVETSETAETTEATEASEDTTAETTEPVTDDTTAPVTEEPSTQPTTEKKLTPSDVKSFKVSNREATKLTLSWKKSKNATKYYLYRAVEKSNGKMGSYALYQTFKDMSRVSYTDKKLTSGRIYKYKIFAYRITKTYTTKSKGSVVKTVTKLVEPATFAVKKATSKSVSLKWSKVNGATDYEIYRKEVGAAEKLIAVTDKLTLVDKNVKSGVGYTYKIKGFRMVDGKKYASPKKAVSAVTAITSVTGVSAKSYLNRALIKWTRVTGATGYDVFTVNSKGKEVLKKSTTSPAYLSARYKTDKLVKFVIKSYKLVGNNKVYGGSKTVSVKIIDTAFGKKPTGTYVEVCTETQEMYMITDGKVYCHTLVVTGNNDGTHETTHGYHTVISKASPARLKGPTWDVQVSFWLGFTYDGQGIHDSTWRTSGYGGEIYKGNGSHGCVNTPYAAAKKIFSKGFTGMPIIVY